MTITLIENLEIEIWKYIKEVIYLSDIKLKTKKELKEEIGRYKKIEKDCRKKLKKQRFVIVRLQYALNSYKED